MRAIALILTLLTSQVASAACKRDDNDCLLRLVLEQTYKLEAEQRRVEHLERALRTSEEMTAAESRNAKRWQDEAKRDNSLPWFVGGLVVGIGASTLLVWVAR